MTLYAKSANRFGQRSLEAHLLDTAEAAELVFQNGSRWREAWLRFFKLAGTDAREYWRALKVAALFHDLGKANDEFQLAVTRNPRAVQSVRHEHLSALIMSLPAVRAWIEQGGVDADAVTAAVLSHHVKAGAGGEHLRDYAWGASRRCSEVSLLLQDTQVTDIMQRVADELGRPAPTLPQDPWEISSGIWFDVLQSGRNYATQLRRALKRDPNRRRFVAALKAGLVVADSVASAVVREGKAMGDWVSVNAHTQPVSAEEVRISIIKKRCRQLKEFQSLVAVQGARVLLLASCGSGKSLAAWAWAEQMAKVHSFGRVIFLYPTRGTATEGFRDYVGWAPEGDSTMLHGSSAFALDGMRDNPPESLEGKDLSAIEADARMFALGLWRFRFFSATVDQFLAFMHNRYQSLCLLPALADSVVIFDEVHSYDTQLFETLLSFLTEFDVPALCMTATLSNQRRQALEANPGPALTPFPRTEHAEQIADLLEQSSKKRYSISLHKEPHEAISLAAERYRKGGRVLIVVNRVARCQEVAGELERMPELRGKAPLVYHSRFKLSDREQRHAEVVARFKSDQPAIAVTTQVCEMSLDLDATLLVTEVAPVASLIQRFGRANRHLKREVADIIVVPPAKPAPYKQKELNPAYDFVAEHLGRRSQQELAVAMECDRYSTQELIGEDAGGFLKGGYYALPGSLREEDDHSVQAVLDVDLDDVIMAHHAKRPLDGWLLPSPRQHAQPGPSSLPSYIHVVDAAAYCPFKGLRSA